jgi:hypothetical protein
MCPAMMPAASLSQSVALQPNSCRSGAIVSAVSVERPVMTTLAPLASASTIGVLPMYALAAMTRSRTSESGRPVSIFNKA